MNKKYYCSRCGDEAYFDKKENKPKLDCGCDLQIKWVNDGLNGRWELGKPVEVNE